MPGADVTYWQRVIDRQESKPATKRRTNRRRSTSTQKAGTSHRPSKRTNYAAQVIARSRAMVEQVERVNGEGKHPGKAHLNQLKQLEKLDPQAHERAKSLLDSGYPAMAGKVIVEAMQAALARLNDPVEKLWRNIVATVESQNLPVISGAQVEVGKLGRKTVYLYRRFDNRFALYDGLGRSSRPIARWGRDWDQVSSAYSGKYKLTDEARRNFELWLEPPEPAAPRKVGHHRLFVK